MERWAKASATTALVRAVLTPTQVLPLRTISRVKGYFLSGLSARESKTSLPAVEQVSIAPVLGQWAVTMVPSASCTSAKNRLWRLIRLPGIKVVAKRMGNDQENRNMLRLPTAAVSDTVREKTK
jgi:hypothetical protein